MAARRCCLWLQSRQSSGAVPTLRGCSSRLTRRGFVVFLPCHWHCSRHQASTTGGKASSIDQTQAAISLMAFFGRRERLPSGAAQRPIRLKNKILPRKAASFPGYSDRRLAITRGRGLCLVGFGYRSGKLADVQPHRREVMTQFKAEVPHPLRNDLPGAPFHKERESTSGKSPVLGLRRLEQAQRRRDADTARPHRQQ